MQQVGKFLGTLKMRKRRHHSWREVWFQLVALHLPEEGEIQGFNFVALAKNSTSAPAVPFIMEYWRYFIDFSIQRQWILDPNYENSHVSKIPAKGSTELPKDRSPTGGSFSRIHHSQHSFSACPEALDEIPKKEKPWGIPSSTLVWT